MKSLQFAYSQGRLLVYGEGPDLRFKAETPASELQVSFRYWKVVELRGALHLAYAGGMEKNYTIYTEDGGFILIHESTKKDRQIALKFARQGDEDRMVFYLYPPEVYKLVYLCDRVIEKYAPIR